MSAGPWQRLGIEATRDVTAIRRAYAKALKAIDPETDPAAFIAVREARDHALAWARQAEPVMEAAFGHPVFPSSGSSPPAEPPLPVDPPPEVRPSFPTEPAPPDRALVEAMRGLDAMLFDPASDARDEAIAAQLGRVLERLASGPIDQERDTEQALAELLVQGSPRSDPMLDPLATYFGWDDDDQHAGDAGLARWVAQRRTDRRFERTLAQEHPRRAALLAMLRSPDDETLGAWKRWWLGPRVEQFLDDLASWHPTTFATLDYERVAAWTSAFARQRAAAAPIRWIRERRLKALSAADQREKASRSDQFWLVILILVVPWFFAWFLLRPGYSWLARVLGFGYLGVILILALSGGPPDPAAAPQGADQEQPRILFRSEREDIGQLLAAYTAGGVTIDALSRRNPALLAQLRADWEFARQHERDYNGLVETAGHRFDDILRAALHGKDAALIRDHARAYVEELQEQSRFDPAVCDETLSGRRTIVTPAYGKVRRRVLVEAVLGGVAPEPEPEAGDNGIVAVKVPDAMLRDAVNRTTLPVATFKEALAGGGTARARCSARMALIETALYSDAGLPVLRKLF